jgi:very-short-patch-repair endonuclease
MFKCTECDREFKTAQARGSHKWRAHGAGADHKPFKGKTWDVNPMFGKNHSESTKQKISVSMTGKTLSSSHKDNISKSMCKAHEENRAHNIGESRWNNEQSYPEKFFTHVIKNEFNDTNYCSELPFGRFSLDFAWIHLKKCIEIDGDQHERFEEYRERDIRKDAALEAEGWKVLRIKWQDMFHDTKTWIKVAKQFIDEE